MQQQRCVTRATRGDVNPQVQASNMGQIFDVVDISDGDLRVSYEEVIEGQLRLDAVEKNKEH